MIPEFFKACIESIGNTRLCLWLAQCCRSIRDGGCRCKKCCGNGSVMPNQGRTKKEIEKSDKKEIEKKEVKITITSPASPTLVTGRSNLSSPTTILSNRQETPGTITPQEGEIASTGIVSTVYGSPQSNSVLEPAIQSAENALQSVSPASKRIKWAVTVKPSFSQSLSDNERKVDGEKKGDGEKTGLDSEEIAYRLHLQANRTPDLFWKPKRPSVDTEKEIMKRSDWPKWIQSKELEQRAEGEPDSKNPFAPGNEDSDDEADIKVKLKIQRRSL